MHNNRTSFAVLDSTDTHDNKCRDIVISGVANDKPIDVRCWDAAEHKHNCANAHECHRRCRDAFYRSF